MIGENNLKNEGLKVYEVGYLLLPVIEDSKIQEESLVIRDIIEKNEGQFLSEGSAEMISLTYPMSKLISGRKQKFDNAYFGWIKFEGSIDSLDKIKESLDKIDNILRYILISTVKENIITPVKTGKFSFTKKEVPSKDIEKVDNKDEKNIKKGKIKKEEDKKTKEEKEIDKKELDDTIDELVIE